MSQEDELLENSRSTNSNDADNVVILTTVNEASDSATIYDNFLSKSNRCSCHDSILLQQQQ